MSRAQRSIAYFAVALLLLAAAATGFVREFSGDFHWHVVVGAKILERHRIYMVDDLSHTFRGAHMFVSSWLADTLFAAAWRAGGYVGCFVLRALALVATFGLLLREMTRRGLGAAASAAILGVILGTQLFAFYLRPETLAYAAFAAVLLSLGAHERGGGWKPVAAALAAILVWANLHGSVGVGLMCIGAYALERAIRTRSWPILTLPPAALAVACMNPEWIRVPLAFRILSPTWVAHVPEWQPLSLRAMPVEVWIFAAVIVVSTVAAGRRTSPWRAVCVLVLALFTLRYQRFIRFALFAAAPLVAGNLAVLRERTRTRMSIAPALATAAAGAWAVWLIVVARGLPREVGLGADPGAYPEAACRFVRDARPPGLMFNSYDYGSYLMSCLPDTPVWIDQRAWSLYPDAFDARYFAAGRSPDTLAALADETHVAWAFMAYDPIAGIMGGDPARWHLVYFDDQALVYQRVPTLPELDLLEPGRLGSLPELPAEAIPRAREQLALQVSRCPDCRRTQLARAALDVAAGDDADFKQIIDRLLEHETPEVVWIGARQALHQHDFARAGALFERFRAAGGDPRLSLVGLAEAAAGAGDTREAGVLLDRAAAMPGGEAMAARMRARLLTPR